MMLRSKKFRMAIFSSLMGWDSQRLLPENQVVAAHSFTVKSEFLKARLGAGCVDE